MPAPTLQFRIAEIDARRASSGAIIECLRFDDEKRQGKSASVIAIAEIHASVYVYERLLDTVHAAITQARALVTKMDGDPMIRFEKIIQKVNEALAQFAAAEATPIQWQRVNLFIFQLAEEHLCFSGIGTLTNAFLQHQENGATKAFDLLGSLEQSEITDPQKPLASIVCGSMGIGDVLFVGTQNLQEIREKIELIPLCQNHPPVTAALEIQQQLTALRSLESYFGVIIAGVALTAPKTSKEVVSPIIEREEPTEVAAPVHAIHEAEQQTDRILEHDAPQPLAQLQALLGRAKNRVSASLQAAKEQRKNAPPRESMSPISLAGLRGMNAGYARGLFAEKRSLILIAILVTGILLGGGLWIRSVRHQQAEQKLWTAIYDETVNAKNRADAALVYGDEDRARTQFSQAMASFQQLDDKTSDRAQARTTLQKDLDAIRARLRKERALATLNVVADLRENGQSFNAQGLIIQNKKAYVLDQSQNRLLIVDLESNATSTLAAPEGTTLHMLGLGREAPLLASDDRQLFTVKNNALSALNTTAIKQPTSITALTTYGQRAYILDALGGLIWRYTLSSTGVTGETSYLKAPADDARRAVGIAIDSSVYLPENDGSVGKFTSGEKDAWSLIAIDPPLKNLTSLWTSVESSSLVVTDPQGKRVVVFNKAGRLLQQLTSPQFQGPTAAWGDAADNSLYILDGGRLIKTDLPRE